MPSGGLILFLLSAAGLVAVSLWAAGHVACDRTARAWIALAIAAMLLGGISMTASIPRLYTPGGFLAAQGLLSAATIWLARAARRRFVPRPGAMADGGPRTAVHNPPKLGSLEWAALSAIVLLLALSLVERSLIPIYQFDDVVYHGSRAGYWVQNQSILPYPTHDLRQTSFPFGAELLFAWTLLFTGSDLLGRLVFWAGLPLTVAGVYSLARVLEAQRLAALFAALLYITAPRVISLASTIKPDLWAPLFALGAAFWIVTALRSQGRCLPAAAPLFWAGVFTALAMSVKIVVGAMIPVLAIASLLIGPWRSAARALLATAAGGLLATMVTGLGFLLVHNIGAHGHPLGPQHFRDIVHAELSLRQLYTHLMRLPLFLVEVPEIPSHDARVWLVSAVEGLLNTLGAGTPLPGEQPGQSPGPMRSPITPRAHRLGVGGTVWFPFLVAGLALCAVELARSWRRPRLSPLAMIVLVQAALLFSVVLLVRWMPHNSVRFWLPAYAVGLGTVAAIPARLARARVGMAAVATIAGGLAAYSTATHTIIRIDWSRSREFRPRDPYWFGPALDLIPDGSTILFLGQGSAHDYPLLAPQGRLVNRVVPWGRQPFDLGRLRGLIAREDPDFVLTWRLPDLAAREFDTWLGETPYARELPLQIPSPTRLVALASGAERPAPTLTAPSETRP